MTHSVKAVFFTIFLTISATASAGELFVRITFESLEPVADEFIGGTMMAEVLNDSGIHVANVNLRPEVAGDLSALQEVLQFGSLAPGDTGIVHAPFRASYSFIDSGRPSIWRLDYDEAGGAHRHLIVSVDQQH